MAVAVVVVIVMVVVGDGMVVKCVLYCCGGCYGCGDWCYCYCG